MTWIPLPVHGRAAGEEGNHDVHSECPDRRRGPTGLTLANELARRGAGVRIVDSSDEPSTQTRALGVQARTLELFEKLDITDGAIARGLRMSQFHVLSELHEILHLDMGHLDSPYPFLLMLPQDDVEQLLAKRLACSGVQVGRGVELVGLRQDPDGVNAVRGEGASVFDDTGKRYLDALASLWYCNVGHGRAELAGAAAAQMRQLAAYQVFEVFSNPPAEALAQRIADLAPMPDAKVFFTAGGGSDAIDTAAKLARAFWRAAGQPGKRVIIARSHAYHGMNAYGTSLGGIPANTEAFDPLVTLVQHVPWDDAAALEKVIKEVGADQVAAFFCEPVVGAGGVYFPPDGYLARVQEICRQHDVLFVVDEVITGFGRTGAWFASERFSLTPDLVTVAKGLTSGYGSTRGLARSGPLV